MTMKWCVMVVCVLASVTSLTAEVPTMASIVNNRADENLDVNSSFVNEIKANLQNNNDDYVIDDKVNVTTMPPGGYRRAYNNSADASADDDEESPSPSSMLASLRASSIAFVRPRKHKKHSIKPKSIATTATVLKASAAVSGAIGNVNKWKRLVEKQRRLRKYTSTPKIVPTPSTRTPHVSRNAPIGRANMMKKWSRRPRPRQVNRDVLPLRSPGPNRLPPNADQLDMAPARGAYIHDLRLKGRFCYRHVLWPEGPKYNSKGETIMPAFNASLYDKKRGFFQTNKPNFMLPRCCNCCKKSVLGCQ